MQQDNIHPQAIVEAGAIIGKNVHIGPWSIIGKDVVIGDNCEISSHVVIKGLTTVGQGNRFFQFSSIGEDCQDLKYAGEPTRLIIGDNNIFRECCTIHRGTIQDNSLTQIGNDNLFMAYTHVAHDCIVGDHCILANNASLAGHVHVGDYAILGGMTGVHQFCHIGAHCFVAANSLVLKDVPPFVMASGHGASPFGLNVEGLKRRGFAKSEILNIKRAYKEVYRKGQLIDKALLELVEMAKASAPVNQFVDFIKQSNRGIIR
jgi:UDP-N-acetylglucosamine acyltransferase